MKYVLTPQAYKEGVHGNKLVWIIVGWYNDDWWTKQDVDCNGEQLLKAAANVIETLPLPLSTSSEPIISRRVRQTVDWLRNFCIYTQKTSTPNALLCVRRFWDVTYPIRLF